MAGLKKPSRKPASGSPNLVLVIFLVFFVLVAIGLGVWGYYGYADKDKLVDAAKGAKKVEDGAKLLADLYKVSSYDARIAIGETLTPDQKVEYEGLRKELMEGSKFASEKAAPDFKKAMEEWSKKLEYDPAEKAYKKPYKAEVAALAAELEKVRGQIATTQAELEKARAQFATLQANQDKYWKNAIAKIEEGNKTVLAAKSGQTDQMEKVIEQNRGLNKELAELNAEKAKERGKFEAQMRELKAQLDELKAVTKTETTTITRSSADPHALLLDISRGKALWDQPVGKVTRADMGRREVTINLGSANGVRPELTFNVFGAGPFGGAEKHLKGTVEVVRVLDAHTSLARITSLFDAEGQEIALNHAGRLRAQREAESALREGDQLFNMFWGGRVAVAGAVNLGGPPSESPAEAMRQLGDFLHVLERQGMAVDAYLDLTDGTIKGAITPRTRFLVLGDTIPAGGLKEAEAERAKAVNEVTAAMRKQAAERGLLLISAENFLVMTGYRSPRGATAGSDTATFRPNVPSAGTIIPGGGPKGKGPADEKMPPMEEKKGEEKKAEEKKGE